MATKLIVFCALAAVANAGYDPYNVDPLPPVPIGLGVEPVRPDPIRPGVYPLPPTTIGLGVDPVRPDPIRPGVYPLPPTTIGLGVYPLRPGRIRPAVYPLNRGSGPDSRYSGTFSDDYTVTRNSNNNYRSFRKWGPDSTYSKTIDIDIDIPFFRKSNVRVRNPEFTTYAVRVARDANAAPPYRPIFAAPGVGKTYAAPAVHTTYAAPVVYTRHAAPIAYHN